MNAEQLEEAMQKIMEQYAGGIGTDYRYSETSLAKADAFMYKLLIKNLAFKRMKTSASFVLIHEGRK